MSSSLLGGDSQTALALSHRPATVVGAPVENSAREPWKVVEYNEPAAIEELAPAWTDLLLQTPFAQPFGHPAWLQTYWRHFGQGQKLRLLVVHCGNQVAGVLPLAVRTETTRLGRLRALTFPLDNWGAWYGPIGPEPAEILRHGLQHVAGSPRDWQTIDLPWLAEPRASLDALATVGLPGVATTWNRTALVDLSAGWDAYWASRTSHWRTNVRSSGKKLHALGAVAYERYRPAGIAAGDCDPRWDLYEACESIAQSSWQGTSTTGTTLTHAAVRDFLRDAHAAAARAGTLDLAILRLDGRPVAFCYNYRYGDYVFGLRSGFDASLGKVGVGSALLHRMLQDGCARGDRLVDLGLDYFAGKRPWHTRRAAIFRVTHYARGSVRARALGLLRAWRRGQRPETDDEATCGRFRLFSV